MTLFRDSPTLVLSFLYAASTELSRHGLLLQRAPLGNRQHPEDRSGRAGSRVSHLLPPPPQIQGLAASMFSWSSQSASSNSICFVQESSSVKLETMYREMFFFFFFLRKKKKQKYLFCDCFSCQSAPAT